MGAAGHATRAADEAPAPAGDDAPARDTRGKALEAGTLYVVATPIGHLADITLRALSTLARADAIYAEDTRVSARLFAHHGISARVRALHRHNEAARADDIVAELAQGRSVALVSDAGTPAVSDPGARVVARVREAGHRVVPVPGASALTAAVSAAGLRAGALHFAGFLPTVAGERDALLDSLVSIDAALVFYEAPHRVVATLRAMAARLGADREVTIARELTKAFETIATMPLGDAAAWIESDANRSRGEFVLLVDASPGREDGEAVLREALRWVDALAGELAPARIAHVVARMTGAPRDALYRHALSLSRSRGA